MAIPKTVQDILLLKSAMSKRNLTSLLLVAAFMGIFVAAGGTLGLRDLRKVAPGDGFGTVKKTGSSEAIEKSSLSVGEPVQSPPAVSPVEPEAIDFPEEEVDFADEDDLSDIEKRLNL